MSDDPDRLYALALVVLRVQEALGARGHNITVAEAVRIVKAHRDSNGGPTNVSATMRHLHSADKTEAEFACWYGDLAAVFGVIESLVTLQGPCLRAGLPAGLMRGQRR